MTTQSMRPLEESLVDLFQHLGIDRAHFVAGQLVPADWVGLAARYPERIASLTLVSPRPGRPELDALGSRLMVLAGDAGPGAQGPARLLGELTQARALVLRVLRVSALVRSGGRSRRRNRVGMVTLS